MSTELPKTYDPAAIEAETYKAWLDEKCFHAEPSNPGEPYAIVIPPPNVTGALHLGHAINNTLQDILTRKARMEGKNALWIPGLDHAGIATQAVVEKTIKEQEGKDRYSLGPTKEASREELIRRIWEWKKQYGDRILSQLQRLGCSCDWDRTRFTLDEMCAKAVRETFFKLFKDGLVYRGKRLVNWDTHLQTSISNDEIYHEKVKTSLWHIRYEIVDGGGKGSGFRVQGSGEDAGDLEQTLVKHTVDETDGAFLESFPADLSPEPRTLNPEPLPRFMTVATTRPETLLGDTAVAVHSQDPRWNWAIGKSVKLPLLGRLIPIIADDILVDPKFGSGVVKVTPAHDPNDYAVYERHLKQADAIEIINILNPDGTLNDAAGPYAGMQRNKSRAKVVADLEAAGLLAKVEPYETEVGHSDRSKTPVEPYLSDQWFVKMAPLAEPALEVVRDGTIQFFPERHAQQYLSWLGEKRDWPISRQLWWGHRIPVWRKRIKTPKDVHDPSQNDIRLATVIQMSDFGSCNLMSSDSVHLAWDKDLWVYWLNDIGSAGEIDIFACINNVSDESAALIAQIEQAGFVQDPDVLDTWFSSALWPFSTLGWPEKTPALDKWYPTSVLLTGRDIITLWVARMVMMGMYNLGATPSPQRGEGGGEGRAAHRPSMSPSPSDAPSLTDDPTAAGDSTMDEAWRRVRRESGNVSPLTPALSPPGRGSQTLDPAKARALGIPFYHVAINPTILDGKGERMSKSKGNGVDPVDIIDTHGADALRFTLATMATETQDVRMPVKKDSAGRNTSDKFDMGRNFCNKLWNASRFALSNLDLTTEARRHGGALEGDSPLVSKPQNENADLANRSNTTSAPPCLRASVVNTLPDRWIVSRFNHTVAEANAALAIYRFDLYAKLCYDFFWRDFCDWYVEAVKPTFKTDAGGASLAVLTNVLDGVLRLMHPVIPFITETIWTKLNEAAPSRPLCGRIEKRLAKSQWPTAGETDDGVEHVFERLQAVIVAIRNVRNEHGVDPRKPVTVSIAPPDDEAERITKENIGLIETLATCKVAAVSANLPAVADAIRVTVNGRCDVYIEGLVDPAADAARSEKRCAELTKQIAALKGRLSNEGYVAKAPPKLIQETRDQLAAAEAELAKLS